MRRLASRGLGPGPSGGVQSLHTAELDQPPGLEVLLLAGPHVLQFDLAPDRSTVSTLLHAQQGANHLITGDFNGDGLDVVTGNTDVVFVFHQFPCEAADTERGRCVR